MFTHADTALIHQLAIPPGAHMVLVHCGYTTVGSLRSDLTWYDHPGLTNAERDMIRQEIGFSRAKIASRFVNS